MEIAIGSDHAGYELKELVKKHLQERGHNIRDFGTESTESTDYPDFAEKVGKVVAAGDFERGILICGTGIGISIAANKIPGVYCGLVGDCFSAKASRWHNNTNVIALGARVIGPGLALEIVDTWLGTEFKGERHQKRIDKIVEIEKRYLNL
ncbi:MAG TPA: ribose 5-phosphate isomerase B [Clostridia bacterium]|nr:ribose 5-phosphate isomerase B [Clostridia bacterium]